MILPSTRDMVTLVVVICLILDWTDRTVPRDVMLVHRLQKLTLSEIFITAFYSTMTRVAAM